MDLQQALDRLKAKGFKYTGKREKMVEIFSEQDRYLSAKEVLAEMKGEYPSLSVDTLYRNLSLFEELEIVEGTEWEGERRYRLHCGGKNHHHHLICRECGKTRPLHQCPMNELLNETEDFRITGHKFEIYGFCGRCESKGEIKA
ncbi:Fur family transcriptional regulator [Marininema halotolerans]|nr:Fur family transcriptional regulator [Marininema halotolerans]